MTIDRRRVLIAGAMGALAAATGCGDTPKESRAGGRSGHPSPHPPASAHHAVVAENALPGDPHWRLDRLGREHEIEGWADRASVVVGEPVGLHVSTTASTYRVSAFRTGWYGGTQARRIWRSGRLRGRLGAAPRLLSPTNTVVTDWAKALTVDTTGWVPGFYIFRLDADSGGQRYIPLVVRSGKAAGKLVVINGDTTWQAYNPFGGYSLYEGPDGAYVDRARAVSFDRPYGGTSAQGAGEFQEHLLPLVSLIERLGLPAEPLSDTDLHQDPHVLDGALAVLTPGHDEYYSTSMRTVLQPARDRGTNLAFFGANAVYRHIRLGATAVGPKRLQTCYKEPAEDPLYGRDNAEVTGQWRYAPDPRPESVLTGVFYESNPVRADMIVTNPGNWLFANSDVSAGMRLPGLIGGEYDRVNLTVPTPRPMEILAHSPLVCQGQASFSDMAYYSTRSGAGVLSTGTNSWIRALRGAFGPVCERVTQSVTETLLRTFVRGPAGRRHPARDNLTRIGGSSV